MLSKAKIKYILSLSNKKIRDKYHQFIIEGEKIIYEVIDSNHSGFKLKTLIADQSYIESIPEKKFKLIDEIIEANPKEIKKVSSQKTPANAIGILSFPNIEIDKKVVSSSLSILLENIQDPGNLGTIIRTADWFGIKNIFCSPTCVDVYNPKVIQSTMGSFLRVNVYYSDLIQIIKEYSNDDFLTYGAFLDGNSLYKENLEQTGFIILGNESKGISPELKKLISNKIFIPPYQNEGNTAESLNVATASAVICSEFRRKGLE